MTGVPLAWDAVVTLTASWQKVFSDDPKIGFFAQRDRFQDALDAGDVLAPAKSVDDMHSVVTNSTVDGVLAAVALTVATTLLIKAGKVKWAWVTGIPLAWDAVVTLTASYQKVFSDDPKLGFFAQRDRFQEALDNGEVLAPAKTLDDMQSVVTNSTVDGVLAALFAVLIVIVIADAARIWVRVLRSRKPQPTTETPFVQSQIVAPAGLIPTAEERLAPARFMRAEEREPTGGRT